MLLRKAAIVQSFGAAPIASLNDPTMLTTKSSNVGPATITTDPISPAAGSLLVAVMRDRSGSNRTHTSVTTPAGLTNLSAWTKVVDVNHNNAGAVPFHRCSIWWAQFSGLAGTGTILATWSGATTVVDLEIIEWTGYDAANPVPAGSVGSAFNNSGTSIGVTMGATPDTESAVLTAFQEHSTVANFSPSSGFTELRESLLTTLKTHTQWQRGNVGAGPFAISGGSNNAVRVMAAIEIRRSTLSNSPFTAEFTAEFGA